ncbi:MAG: sigma-54-dependent Fis family transcriptional regulator [Alphaproteobacteria bacterium]|nr:sigma-54-dependent Fis family transcriptional regulator [Alphaproteobacteria bacterium]
MPRSIVVLEPPGGVLRDLARALRTAADPGCAVTGVATVDALLDLLGAGAHVDLVVVDAHHGDGALDGLSVIARVRALDPYLPVIATAAHADVDSAARAVDAGANDLLVRGPRLVERVTTLLRKLHLLLDLSDRTRRDGARLAERHRIIGTSAPVQALVERIARVAAIPRPVLVVGERGTGKELVAWNLHALAGRTGRPMVCVNCAAFSESLLESELFGHEQGAYTGAVQRAAGCFEQADGGTLFLDEVGAMPLGFQQKILRAVEYGVFRRVGGTADVRTRARIVAATNADLSDRIADGTFLPDLYDRLAFEVIEVPALRDRREDVPALAAWFLARFGEEVPELAGITLSDGACAALMAHDWPGNVRELRHTIERAAYRFRDGVIRADDLGLPRGPAPGPPPAGGFKERVAAYKDTLLQEALDAAGGNQAEAARRLGLTYDQLRYHLRRSA